MTTLQLSDDNAQWCMNTQKPFIDSSSQTRL